MLHVMIGSSRLYPQKNVLDASLKVRSFALFMLLLGISVCGSKGIQLIFFSWRRVLLWLPSSLKCPLFRVVLRWKKVVCRLLRSARQLSGRQGHKTTKCISNERTERRNGMFYYSVRRSGREWSASGINYTRRTLSDTTVHPMTWWSDCNLFLSLPSQGNHANLSQTDTLGE